MSRFTSTILDSSPFKTLSYENAAQVSLCGISIAILGNRISSNRTSLYEHTEMKYASPKVEDMVPTEPLGQCLLIVLHSSVHESIAN